VDKFSFEFWREINSSWKKKFLQIFNKISNKKQRKKIFFRQRDLIQNMQIKKFNLKFYLIKQKKNKKIKMAENFCFDNAKFL
jgi:hypothetical protein